MKLVAKIIIIGSICGALIIFSAFWRHDPKQANLENDSATLFLRPIESQKMFYDPVNFKQAILSAEKVRSQNDIQAVVVPQHLVASSLMAQAIKQAAGRDIETVFIIGPNHFNVGTADIASAQAVWKTDLGDVESDTGLVSKFITDLNLLNGPEIFINEHAVGALVPFVKYYLPQAKIVPIVFRSYSNLGDVDQVVNWLADNLPKKSLVIYSIDFSHYLSREQADHMDELTRQYITNNDLEQIIKLGDDNLDSPASLATALSLAQKKNWHLEIVANKNSDDFTKVKSTQTTSYFLINFLD